MLSDDEPVVSVEGGTGAQQGKETNVGFVHADGVPLMNKHFEGCRGNFGGN